MCFLFYFEFLIDFLNDILLIILFIYSKRRFEKYIFLLFEKKRKALNYIIKNIIALMILIEKMYNI